MDASHKTILSHIDTYFVATIYLRVLSDYLGHMNYTFKYSIGPFSSQFAKNTAGVHRFIQGWRTTYHQNTPCPVCILSTPIYFNDFNRIPPEESANRGWKPPWPSFMHIEFDISHTIHVYHKNQRHVGEYTIDELFGYWGSFSSQEGHLLFFYLGEKKNANDSPKAHGAFSAHLICEGPLRRDLASLPVEMAHLWRTIFGSLKLTAKASL